MVRQGPLGLGRCLFRNELSRITRINVVFNNCTVFFRKFFFSFLSVERTHASQFSLRSREPFCLHGKRVTRPHTLHRRIPFTISLLLAYSTTLERSEDGAHYTAVTLNVVSILRTVVCNVDDLIGDGNFTFC